jgi:hypothetical protein
MYKTFKLPNISKLFLISCFFLVGLALTLSAISLFEKIDIKSLSLSAKAQSAAAPTLVDNKVYSFTNFSDATLSIGAPDFKSGVSNTVKVMRTNTSDPNQQFVYKKSTETKGWLYLQGTSKVLSRSYNSAIVVEKVSVPNPNISLLNGFAPGSTVILIDGYTFSIGSDSLNQPSYLSYPDFNSSQMIQKANILNVVPKIL